jgi:hypothetical protein
MNKTERMKLVRILGMLGSEHDGERASAAMAAHRVIQAAGTSWAQLLAEVPGEAKTVRVASPDPWVNPSEAAQSRIRQVQLENERLAKENKRLRARLEVRKERPR